LFIVQENSLNNFSESALLVMKNSLTSNQVCAETFPDGALIRCRYIRVQQALDSYPLKRAKLYEKLSSGEIKSFCLKERGALKGVRLIDRDSYDDYLQRAAETALAADSQTKLTAQAEEFGNGCPR
jgi:hypothetical protein